MVQHAAAASPDPNAGLFRACPPSPALAPWIESLWIQERPPGPHAWHRVLPDGSAHLLVDLSRPEEPRASVVAPMATALVIRCNTWSRVLGVRFRPGAARAFLGVPMRELAAGRLDLEELWSDAAELREEMAEADATGASVAALDRALCARVPEAGRPEPRVRALVARLAGEARLAPIQALAEQAGLTRQHLARLFRDEVGLEPKRLARIVRLRRALRLLRAGSGSSLAAIALEAGYSDQPHMNADFRALAGAAPLELLGSAVQRERTDSK
jgi:AraC-like DNA-binding protein